MKKPLLFAPFLFYPVEFVLWVIASLGLMAGVDINKFLGLLGVIAWPIYGLFILGSVIVHIILLVRGRHRWILPLFLANVIGIIGYIILVLLVLQFACYGGGSCW